MFSKQEVHFTPLKNMFLVMVGANKQPFEFICVTHLNASHSENIEKKSSVTPNRNFRGYRGKLCIMFYKNRISSATLSCIILWHTLSEKYLFYALPTRPVKFMSSESLVQSDVLPALPHISHHMHHHSAVGFSFRYRLCDN